MVWIPAWLCSDSRDRPCFDAAILFEPLIILNKIVYRHGVIGIDYSVHRDAVFFYVNSS